MTPIFRNDGGGSPLSQFGGNRQYSLSQTPSLGFNNPIVTMLANAMLGQSIFPQVTGTNSAYDMMQLRYRNMQYAQIMQSSFAQSQMARIIGVDPNNPIMKYGASFFADPNGMIMRSMAPLIGGNPIQAQMGLYADMGGMTMMQAGHYGNMSAAQTGDMMGGLYKSFYKPANTQGYMSRAMEPLRGLGFNPSDPNFSWSSDTASKYSRIAGQLGGLQLTEGNRGALEGLIGELPSDIKTKLSKSFEEAVKGGTDAGFKSAIDNLKTGAGLINTVADAASGKIPGAQNYAWNRGFQIQDITQAYADLQRGGFIKGKNAGTPEGLENFGSGVAMLGAARGLFGNDLSGRELSAAFQGLMGGSYANMGNDADARKMEETLRNVKSMARVANVGISSMIGIVDQIKGMTGLGGIPAMNLANTAMMTSAVFGAGGDPRIQALLGGPAGVIAAQTRGMAQSQEAPITASLGAIYYQATEKYGKDSSIARDILRYGNDGNKTAMGFAAFINTTARKMGMSPYLLQQAAANNPMASRLGLEAAPELANAGTGALMDTAFQSIGQQLGDTGHMATLLPELMNDPKYAQAQSPAQLRNMILSNPKFRGMRAGAVSGARLQRLFDLSRHSGNASIATMMSTLGVVSPEAVEFANNGGDAILYRKYNPTGRALAARMSKDTAVGAAMEAEISKKSGMVHSTIFSRIFQQAIEGKLDKSTITSLIAGGAAGDFYDLAAKHLNAAQSVNAEGLSAEKIDTAMRENYQISGYANLADLSGNKKIDFDALNLKANDPAAQEKAIAEIAENKQVSQTQIKAALLTYNQMGGTSSAKKFSEEQLRKGIRGSAISSTGLATTLTAGLKSALSKRERDQLYNLSDGSILDGKGTYDFESLGKLMHDPKALAKMSNPLKGKINSYVQMFEEQAKNFDMSAAEEKAGPGDIVKAIVDLTKTLGNATQLP